MNKLIPFLMTLALLLVPLGPAAFAQQQLTDPTVVKIKTDVEKRLRNKKTNVNVKFRNGAELKGKITQVAENGFTLKVKKDTRDISYTDVTKVKGQGLKQRSKVRYTHRDYYGRSCHRCFNQSEEFRSF